MTERKDYSIAPAFSDLKNITVGKARVIYAEPTQCGMAKSWVLPGGRRTENFEVAHGYATRMNALMAEMEGRAQ